VAYRATPGELCELKGRNQNLIRFFEQNGTADLIRPVLQKLSPTSEVDPRVYFTQFVHEMQYFRAPDWLNSHYRRIFDGGIARFYTDGKIVMIMYRRRARAFMLYSDVTPQRPERAMKPKEMEVSMHRSGALVPKGHSVFAAALSSQIPSRGRLVPKGVIDPSSSRRARA
jgi:hypothetical protein